MSILEISLLIVWVNITSNKFNCSKSGVEIHSAVLLIFVKKYIKVYKSIYNILIFFGDKNLSTTIYSVLRLDTSRHI